MKKETTILDSLKQGEIFWYKLGKFSVKNKNCPKGIDCTLLGGTYKELSVGDSVILKRKTPVSLKSFPLIGTSPDVRATRNTFSKTKTKKR